ncbi:MAG: hypothetical protein ACYTEQ_18100, partial [Planctomycetota bacterium]
SRDARELANTWERVLQWELNRSARRRRNLRADLIWSAAVYDEIAIQITHIPTQFKLAGTTPSRKRAALRYGDWAFRVVDPQEVFVRYSEYMPESVLYASVKTAQQLVDAWPKTSKEIAAEIQKDPKAANEKYIEFDMVDHEGGRSVWYIKGHTVNELDSADGYYLMKPQPWLKVIDTQDQVPFLNWVCVAGGTTVEALPEFQRKPLLYPIVRANLWSATNMMGAILMSKALATAAAPEHVLYGPGADQIDIDYTVPGGKIVMPTKTLHEYQPAPQRGLDPSLTEGYDRLSEYMTRAGPAETLVSGQPMSGEQAYASFNLQVQQALASIGNVKGLGERAMEAVYEQMLLIAHYTGQDIESYAGGDYKYVIDSEDIDPDNIQISVELKTDVPMDRMARINAAAQLAGSGVPMPMAEILKSLGVTDAEGFAKRWAREQMEMADLQGVLQGIQMERSGELQQMAQQMAQQMIEQMMQQQEQQMQQQQQGQQPGAQGPMGQMANPANPMNAPGIPGVGGQGVNPAQGGGPPQQGAPEYTREQAQEMMGT